MTALAAPQAAPVSPALRTPLHGAPQSPERMRQAARDFEAQVLGQLLQPAFATVDMSKSAFGGGSAEGQWRPMLVDAFAASAARAGRGIGLGEMVLRHMLRVQEASTNQQETSR
jgi:flagellar protein FlgJ